MTNSGQAKNNEITKAMMDVEIVPNFSTEELSNKNAIKIPLAELALAGGALASMTETFRTVTQTFELPMDGLFRFDSRGYEGYVAKLKGDGGQLTAMVKPGEGIIGNGVYRPVDSIKGSSTAVMAVDPITLAIAVAMADISSKLDDIQKTQEEILSILEEDKKAAIKGNIKFLVDTLNNFKLNVDNEKFLSTRRQEVVAVERESEKSIEYYRAQIEKVKNEKGLINIDKDITERTQKLESLLGQYQASLYVLGFATYIDVMLTENFSADYLKRITTKLEQYSNNYRMTYTDVYNVIEEQSSSSVESFLLGGLSTFSKFTGDAISKIPVISDGPVDEALIGVGDSLGDINNQREDVLKNKLIARNDSCIVGFMEKIKQVDMLFNAPTMYYFDGDNIYCEPHKIA